MTWNQQHCINGGSVSSGSPIMSPLASPLHSPCDSPREQLHNQFARQVSLQPPVTIPAGAMATTVPSTGGGIKQSSGNTFVHKLFNMVVDKQYQHLIAWTYTGTSFIVCNITEFSREVLPKHFKHNNFSSFVRQLNMYGFHKINKSPRGHRALAENQIWEFSHPKFLRGRGDLLDDIKRKALEAEVVRRDQGDLNTHMAVMQVAQSDMMQQLNQLQENFNEIVRELADTRRQQQSQKQLLKELVNYMVHQQGAPLQIPVEYNIKPDPEQQPPPIYITSPAITDPRQHQQQRQQHHHSFYSPSPSPPPQPHTPNPTHPHQQDPVVSLPSRPAVPLTVQTHNLENTSRMHIASPSVHSIDPPSQQQQLSPMVAVATNTPLPPSPSTLLSDDDIFYTPHPSPGLLHRNLSAGHLVPEGFATQNHHHHQQQLEPQQPTMTYMHHGGAA
ncbi:HSF-type DNA-binding-domain-containing protein [Dichotomocladium elegans]|nr:HSF-type DNA-binding-domain-containing protein [Dichotomocladium elegans]